MAQINNYSLKGKTMEKKAQKAKFTHFYNEEHFQLGQTVITLFEKYEIKNPSLLEEFATYKSLCLNEGELLEKIRKSSFTDIIQQLDEQRDNAYLGIKNLIKAYLYHYEHETAEAARKLNIIIKHYGNINRKSYNNETGTITNFVQDMNKYSDDLSKLHLLEWMAQLEHLNKEFDKTLNLRYDEKYNSLSVSLREVRLKVDESYRRIISLIEALYLIEKETIYADFIDELNVRIEYYRNTMNIRKGKAEANKKKEQESAE